MKELFVSETPVCPSHHNINWDQELSMTRVTSYTEVLSLNSCAKEFLDGLEFQGVYLRMVLPFASVFQLAC